MMLKLPVVSIILLTSIAYELQSQRAIHSERISAENVELEEGPLVLARFEADIPDSGTVIVHFTGQCYFDVGDLIVLAASDHANWGPLDEHIEIETEDAEKGKTFSHTRTYRVGPGVFRAYAMAENAIKVEGNGHASIKGLLTVEFIPDVDEVVVISKRVAYANDNPDINLAASGTIQVPSFGQVIVRFDGYVVSLPGDDIILAASDEAHWGSGPGHITVNAYEDIRQNSFSHTNIFYVDDPGEFTYHGVVQNHDIADTGGEYEVYGHLLIEFYPYSLAAVGGYQLPEMLHADTITPVKRINFHAPGPGYVLLNMDGWMRSFYASAMQLGVSDVPAYINDDNVILSLPDVNGLSSYPYVHAAVIPVEAGSHTFYALGQVLDTPEPIDYAYLTGNFSLKYFPGEITSVDKPDDRGDLLIYPVPARESITVSFGKNKALLPVMLFDMQGRHQPAGQIRTDQHVVLDLEMCMPGLYFLKVGEEVRKILKI